MRQQLSERFEARSADGRASRLRPHVRLLAMGGALVVAITLACAAIPSRAEALPVISPILNGASSVVGGVLGAVGGGIASLATGAFDAIIKHLFAPITKFVTVEVIGWLVAVPNFTTGPNNSIAALETTVVAMGGGLLGAVATFSVIRYWLAGFAGGGEAGFVALEGLTRTVGAALALALWPWLFDSAVKLVNLFTSSLMGSGHVIANTARLLATGVGAAAITSGAFAPLGLFLAIAVAIAASLLFLGLLLLKIALSVSTILVFVGMPLAIVFWPAAPWVARLAGRALIVCLAVPVLWALCFAASGAVGVDALTFTGGGAIDKLVQPLVAIVLLWVTIKLPVTLARAAMLGAQALGGGFVSRAVSYAAGSQLRDTVREHVGANKPTNASSESSASDSRTAGRLRSAATLAGAAATAGATGGAAAGAGIGAARGGAATGIKASSAASAVASNGAAGAGSSRGYTRPATAEAQTAGRGLQNGLSTPAFRKDDHDAEMVEAQFRERVNPVSTEQAKAALRAFPRRRRRALPISPLITAPAPASIWPTRRPESGQPANVRRCARSRPPAPRSARKRPEACSTAPTSRQPHSRATRPQRVPRSSPQVATPASASGAGAPAGAESVTLGEIGAGVSGGDPIEQPPVENSDGSNGAGSNAGQTGSQPANGGTEGFGSAAGGASGTPSSSPNPVEQPALGTEGFGSAAGGGGGTPSSSPNPGKQPGVGFRPAERWAGGRWRAAGA